MAETVNNIQNAIIYVIAANYYYILQQMNEHWISFFTQAINNLTNLI
jgi:hypothetical protein